MTDYNFEKLHVLAVDDNRHMLTILKAILRGLGVRNVKLASDAVEAFKEMQHFPADLVFVDWMMMPLDGLDFVRLVRTAKDSANPYIPIIMMTGHSEMHRVIEARNAGANAFLVKPVSPKSLYGRLVEIVEVPRSFIRTNDYFGPDRRRRNEDYKGFDRRIPDTSAVEMTAEQVGRMLPSFERPGAPPRT